MLKAACNKEVQLTFLHHGPCAQTPENTAMLGKNNREFHEMHCGSSLNSTGLFFYLWLHVAVGDGFWSVLFQTCSVPYQKFWNSLHSRYFKMALNPSQSFEWIISRDGCSQSHGFLLRNRLLCQHFRAPGLCLFNLHLPTMDFLPSLDE